MSIVVQPLGSRQKFILGGEWRTVGTGGAATNVLRDGVAGAWTHKVERRRPGSRNLGLFVSKEKGRFYSPAAVFADQHTSSAVGLFNINEDYFWFVRVNHGAVIADQIFTDREAGLEAVGEHEGETASVAGNIYVLEGDEEKNRKAADLTAVFHAVSSARVNSRPRRGLRMLAAAGAVVVLAVTAALVFERLERQEVALLSMPEKAAVKIIYPTIVPAQAFIEQCAAKIWGIIAGPPKGWWVEHVTCHGAGKVVAAFARDASGLNQDMRRAYDGVVIYLTQRNAVATIAGGFDGRPRLVRSPPPLAATQDAMQSFERVLTASVSIQSVRRVTVERPYETYVFSFRTGPPGRALAKAERAEEPRRRGHGF